MKSVVAVKTITWLKSVRKEFHCILGRDHKSVIINIEQTFMWAFKEVALQGVNR